MSEMSALERLAGGLMVSCQAREWNPLHGPVYMSAMAVAAESGSTVRRQPLPMSFDNDPLWRLRHALAGLGVALGPPASYSALPDSQRAVLRF